MGLIMNVFKEKLSKTNTKLLNNVFFSAKSINENKTTFLKFNHRKVYYFNYYSNVFVSWSLLKKLWVSRRKKIQSI